MKVAEITVYSTSNWFDKYVKSFFFIPLIHIEVNVDGETFSYGDDKEGLDCVESFVFGIYKENMMFQQIPSHVSAIRLAEIIVGEIEELDYYGAEALTIEYYELEGAMRDIAGIG